MKIEFKRKLIQAITTIGINSNFKGFFEGNIYMGEGKKICVPGLNCYSCPGALGSCPLGSLQATMHKVRTHVSLYVVGLLVIFGALLGRVVCGYLCPFGLFQELLHKIPINKGFMKKAKSPRIHDKIKYTKYIVLLLFVLILPLLITQGGIAIPWFCKWICPAGTLEGGWLLPIMNEKLRTALGTLFTWKSILLTLIIVLSIKYFRPFCKYLCPLGLIYGFFNKIAAYRFEIDIEKCIKCSKCAKACPMEIETYKSPNSIECIRCGKCREVCPTEAILSGVEVYRKCNSKCLKDSAEN